MPSTDFRLENRLDNQPACSTYMGRRYACCTFDSSCVLLCSLGRELCV